jgi:hypothetical protein
MLHLFGRPHLDFGQTHAQPLMGVQGSPGEEHEGRTAAASGANWSMVCLHAAGSHPPAAAEAGIPEFPNMEREARKTP